MNRTQLGHGWVVDAMMERCRDVVMYVNGRKYKTTKETSYLLNCNWGWNGTDNGYFSSGAFNTKTNGSFNTNNKMIVYIKK